jgi:hypothetical protein
VGGEGVAEPVEAGEAELSAVPEDEDEDSLLDLISSFGMEEPEQSVKETPNTRGGKGGKKK